MYKLYFANISDYYDEKTYKKGYQKVCQYRKNKIDSCKNEDDKIRSLVAGLLFEEACEEYNITNLLDKLKDGEHGKPFFDCDDDQFPGEQRIHFNISHSGKQVMVGMSDTPIGVDIQEMKPLKADIASRYFTEKEQDLYFRASEEECDKILYKIWCLKESYVKFTGKGLMEGLETFSVLDHMMDAGIWQDEYAYSVTTTDYKVEQGILDIETTKPMTKDELAAKILSKDEKKELSAPAPEERTDKEILISALKDEKTVRPMSEEEVHAKVVEAQAENQQIAEAAKETNKDTNNEVKEKVTEEADTKKEPKPVTYTEEVKVLRSTPDQVTYEIKKRDTLSRSCGITRCKYYRNLLKFR